MPILYDEANIAFGYLYRDAATLKTKDVWYFGGDELSTENATARLEAAFDASCSVAHQLGIPEIYFGLISKDDHCWHEFDGFEETTDRETDQRTLTEFVGVCEEAAKQGWDVAAAQDDVLTMYDDSLALAIQESLAGPANEELVRRLEDLRKRSVNRSS